MVLGGWVFLMSKVPLYLTTKEKQGLLEIGDTHRPRTLRYFDAWEHRTLRCVS